MWRSKHSTFKQGKIRSLGVHKCSCVVILTRNNPHDLQNFIFFSAQYVISLRETKPFEVTRGRTQNSRLRVWMDLHLRDLRVCSWVDNWYINLGVVTPFCLLMDICFYYQREHNTSNTMHSFIFYSMFRLFISAIFRYNQNDINTGVEASPSHLCVKVPYFDYSLCRNGIKMYTVVVKI